MQEIIKKLKERGTVDSLQFCLNAGSKILGGKLNDEKRNFKALKETLINSILRGDGDEDNELADEFMEFAIDLAAEAIIKELDLKADKNYEADTLDSLIMAMALMTMKAIKEDK